MAFIEQLKRVITRQNLMESLGIKDEKMKKQLEVARSYLYCHATDAELLEYAEQSASLIGEDVNSFFETLKRIREVAVANTEQWQKEYGKWEGQ